MTTATLIYECRGEKAISELQRNPQPITVQHKITRLNVRTPIVCCNPKTAKWKSPLAKSKEKRSQSGQENIETVLVLVHKPKSIQTSDTL